MRENEKQWPASEFGGKVNKHGIQPKPHSPTPSEELSLTYRGVPFNDTEGATFQGLRPYDELYEEKEKQGYFKKGEVWEEWNK